MKAFLVGVIFLIAVVIIAGLGYLFVPLILVLGLFLRFILLIVLGILVVWILGKFIIFVWEALRKKQGRCEMVRRVKQIVIAAEDRPGMLSEITQLIAGENINIEAIKAFVDSKGKANFYIITADNQKALSVLGSGGLPGREEEVLALELENKPGALGKMASKLKEKKVNLLYCYGTVGQAGSPARFIMKAENNDQAIEALR